MDDITKGISEASSCTEALRLLLQVHEPQSTLRVLNPDRSLCGQIWVKEGKTITAASRVTGSTGYMALLELLALRQSHFQLAQSSDLADGETLDLPLKEAIADEAKFIDKIKAILWPVTEPVEEAEQPDAPDTAKPAAEASSPTAGERANDSKEGKADKVDVPQRPALSDDAWLQMTAAEGCTPVVPFRTLSKEPSEAIVNERDYDPEWLTAQSELSKAADDQVEKRLNEYDQLKERGETKERFYEESEKLRSLANKPTKEESAKPESADDPEWLTAKTELSNEHDDQVHKRLKQYDELKEDGQPKEQFWQEGEVPLKAANSEGLPEDRRSELESMAREFPNDSSFEEKQPELADTGSTRPVWEPEPAQTDMPAAAMVGGSAASGLPASAAETANPEQAGALNARKLKGSLGSGDKDQFSIINRPPTATHGIAAVLHLPKISERIPRQILVPAAIVLTALPLIAGLLVVSANAEKRAMAEDLASTTAAVDRTMDEQSPTRQPQQAFRLPEAPAACATAPAGNPVGNAGDQIVATTDDPMVNMKFSKPLKAAPVLSQDQTDEIGKRMQDGAAKSSQGNVKEALAGYLAMLERYPCHARLRLCAIEACLQLKDYQQARSLCLQGMQLAQNQTEFDIFLNKLKNLPGVSASHVRPLAPKLPNK